MNTDLVSFLDALVAGREFQTPPADAALGEVLQKLKAAVSTLRSSEEKYRLMTEHVSIGIIVVQEGKFCYANPAAMTVTGYSATEMLGRDFAPLIYPDDRALVADRHARRSRGETVEPRYDFRILRRDGSVAWVQLAAVVIPWEGATATLSFLNDITDRKLAEDAVRRSEERYRSVIEAAPLGVVIVRNNLVRFANPAMQAMLGLSLEQLIAAGSFLGHVHPEDRGLMATVARSAVEQPVGSQAVTAFRIIAADGRMIWVEGNSVQVEWKGQPATLAYIRDVSARRELENQVAEALNERETMLENSVVGIAFLNPEGRLHWANKAMEQIFGTDVAAKIGSSLESYYFSREDYLRVGGAVSRAVRAGLTFAEEVQMRRADDSLFWAYLSGKAVNPKDLSRGTVWVVMDIDRRKQLEVALQHKTAEQEAILQSTQIGITYSVDRVHQWCNETFAAMLGFDVHELIGSSSLMHFQDRESWEALGASAYPVLARGEAYSDEVWLKRKDGTLIWVQLHGKTIDANDPGRGSIWTFVDITQRHLAEEGTRRALEQQRELNEMKSRFVSMTSHEFRTPLATILSSTELLRYYGARLPDEEKSEILGSIESAVQRMAHMLDGILMIGRADAGKLEFHPVAIAAGPLVRTIATETARVVATGTAEDRLMVRDNSDNTLWRLDEKLLRHIVGNLVGNAFKYSPTGGAVEIDVDCMANELQIRVSDHGIGIPEADLPRLFETFHRAANVGNISGTGLGLAIVKRAVDLHGGHIEVSSVAGEGTRFTVSLPTRA